MKATQGAKRRRRRAVRGVPQESTVAIVDRLLARPHLIKLNGEPQEVMTIEAILLQLQQKAMFGGDGVSKRAWRAMQKYHDFAVRHADRKLQVQYVENDYIRAFKKAGKVKPNG